jgi:hypothetical protein
MAIRRIHLGGLAIKTALAISIWGAAGHAREPEDSTQQSAASESSQSDQTSVQLPCISPAPIVGWEDYEGPFAKVVGAFARKLELKSVHPPHYKPGAMMCTLALKDKFVLFVQDTFDPVTFLNVGFSAGIAQAEGSYPGFGQGAAGYGKRFGAGFTGQASAGFFKDFAYPAIFSEDPRYYRQEHGGGKRRLFHAFQHVFIAYRENGTQMFNATEWLGTTSSVLLSNIYLPNVRRGFVPAAERIGYNIGSDMGFDVLREFWPEIARKLRLPFRGQGEESQTPSAGGAERNGIPRL